ncbi:MAG: UDP-N-acetylglucosamine 1-carboxyvinyltransferase [Planctomycetes bacterium]|nr:UDP-N-acetylglucosamine 1-carboxyvinyltransferase [Planctomycetota bacterium]
MDRFVIEGGRKLSGSVRVGGSKNAALPILFATLMTRGRSRVHNVPRLRDVEFTLTILRELGMAAEWLGEHTIELEVVDEAPCEARYDLVRRMRASFCVLGPLLARRGKARVAMPGGCAIGVRPVDLHKKGLEALGATLPLEHGYFDAVATRLRGAEVFLGGHTGPTVTGTANVMMAATLAEGTTVIEGAACEPEVTDLADFLVACGARVQGQGTPRIAVEGVSELRGCDYTVIPDRIEAGTLVLAGAMANSDIRVEGARGDHLGAVSDVLRQIGIRVVREDGGLRVHASRDVDPVDVTTQPYPGFPTDLQSQLMALLTIADGISVITETIYPDRFMHVAELNRMGASIRKQGASAVVSGQRQLSGAEVMASDLRASAALVLAGLVAKGVTEIQRVYHLDRGYERLDERLAGLGAAIRRVEGPGEAFEGGVA